MSTSAWFITPTDTDLDAFATETQQREDAYQNTSPATAQNAGKIAATYADLSPGVVAAMAQSGIDPQSATAKQIADIQSQVNKKKKANWFEKAKDETYGAVKAGVRGATMGLEAPFQFGSAAVRTIAGGGGSLEDVVDQTNLGQVVKAGLNGEKINTGSGFFTQEQFKKNVDGSYVTDENGKRVVDETSIASKQSQATRDAYTIDGHGATLGRWVATRLFQPDTGAYNVLSGTIDAITVLGLDPTNKIGKIAKEANVARKTFTPARGLLNWNRPAVLLDQAKDYMNSNAGRKFVDWATENTDMDKIWKTTDKKWTPEFAAKIADATDKTEVKQLLTDEIANGRMIDRPYQSPFAEWKPVGGYGIGVKRWVEKQRAFNLTPGDKFILGDGAQSVEQLDRTLTNANLDRGRIAEWNGKLARATSNEQRRSLILDAMSEVQEHLLTKRGVTQENAAKLTKAFRGQDDTMKSFVGDELTSDTPVPWIAMDGQHYRIPKPFLLAENNNEYLPNFSRDNIAEIRRVTGKFGSVLNNPAVTVPERALKFVNDRWKESALLRGAYTVRVVGEEQVRMAASNLTSFANNPLSAIAWIVGDNGIEKRIPGLGKDVSLDLQKLSGGLVKTGRGQIDVWGKRFDDEGRAMDGLTEWAQSLNRKAADDTFAKRRAYKGWQRNVTQQDEGYIKGWQEEAGVLASDPIARKVAGGVSPNDFSGDFTPSGNNVEDVKNWLKFGSGRSFRTQLSERRGWEDFATNDDLVDKYVDDLGGVVNKIVGQDADLGELIANKTIGGKAASRKDVEAMLNAKRDAGLGPQNVRSPMGEYDAEQKGLYKQTVDHMFDVLMTRPSNELSRSTAFRQFYWDRIGQLAPSMTADAQKAVLKAAEDAALPKAQLKKLNEMVKGNKGTIDLDGADLVAKGHALDTTQALLYSPDGGLNLFESTKLLFPFGNAWKEVLGVWSKIGKEDPTILRKGQLIVEGGRDADPDGDGEGFFYTDENGNEVFNYPLTGKVNKAITGVDAPFKGTVAGLNVFSNNPLLPGLSPFVQWPAGSLIPDTPKNDWIKDLINPVGETDRSNGVVESFAPAWMKKMYTAGFGDANTDKQMNTAVGRIMAQKAQSGEYDTSDPESLAKLKADSIKSAKGLFVMRGMLQFFAPTAPSPKWLAHDKQGQTTTVSKLLDEYHKLQQNPDGSYNEDADAAFMDRFGEDAFLYMQPLSKGGFQPLSDLHDFVRENPELVTKYPKAYGYFAGSGGQYSADEQERQFANGEREQLSPDDVLALANTRVAKLQYRQAKKEIGATPNEEQRQWLRDFQDRLAKQYPGYEPDAMTLGATQTKVRQLQDAAADPSLKNNEAAKGMQAYFEFRKEAEAQDPSFATTKRSRALRDWLRDMGTKVTRQYPAFSDAWVDVLSRELKDDAAADEAANGAQK
jgi:hypothetical protein